MSIYTAIRQTHRSNCRTQGPAAIVSLNLCRAYLKCYVNANPPSTETIREGFLSLTDLSHLSDGGSQWKWALLYQDFPAQGIYARELRYASPRAVATELTKLFLFLGPPDHLYAYETRKRFVRVVLRHVSENMPHNIQIKRGRHLKHFMYNFAEFHTRLLTWLSENRFIHWRFGVQECAGYLTRRARCFREPPPISEIESIVQDALLVYNVFGRVSSQASVGLEDDGSGAIDKDAHESQASVGLEDDGIGAIDEDAHESQASVGLEDDGNGAIDEDSHESRASYTQNTPVSITTPADASLEDTNSDQVVPQHQINYPLGKYENECFVLNASK